MKLASFMHNEQPGYGAVVDGGIVDLSQRTPYATLRDALAAGALPTIAEALQGATPDRHLAEVQLRTPVPDADKIICIGRNYRGHVAEGNLKLPEYPSVFLRLHNSLVPSGAPIVKPRQSDQFDFEGELALVIGRAGRHIRPENALAHVAGYTCFMDGSIRDIQFIHSLTAGKNFFASGSWGPVLVTTDDTPDPTQLTLVTRLNGAEVQRTRTDDLIFDIPAIIAYVSAFTELLPGDVIATGTPEGVGFASTPPLWLKAGDALEVDIAGIGLLCNAVIAEQTNAAVGTMQH